MNKLTNLLGRCLIVSTLAVQAVMAATPVSDTQAFVLLDKSGMTQAIDGLPTQMQVMGQQLALTSKNAEQHQAFMDIFLGSLDPDDMLQEMALYVAQNASEEDFDAYLQWLNSDIAKKLVSAELEASEEGYQRKFVLFLADLQANPPAVERRQAVLQFVEASQLVEQSYLLMKSVAENMIAGIKASQPENQQLIASMDQALAQLGEGLKPMLEQQMVLTAYYLYRNMSNEDLAQYTAFYTGDVGQRYLELLYGATMDAMGKWGQAFILDVAAAKAPEALPQ